ncbi:ABC transporter ATP-binding protein [Yersinia alsatica]|uniref:ABC transporter ATP-binding protein n=1 Tax=Yersinia alsatica TaxID=2890317 RepID=A0ABY5ULS3_9GAMM|nr:ABC transporter ATP-binding protein [Yersinia alsatica]OWF68111.1 sugar ABC transporter ATP-binding protein [Yersinia frederiksenii]UWM44426.1 ABC transporter ATP-binding protein [Yersinia alsatica]CNK83971.1 ABC transporter [Yersinia frederiksenii]CNK92333.1 ABC transporter [Yersinia frederiksenii]
MENNIAIARICLEDVSLDYPIYNARAFSLRHKLAKAVTGGRILSDAGNTTIVRALSNINLEINKGDRVGIIGHNGAGKTTLLRCISGIYQPTSGKLYREGTLGAYLEIGAGLEPELSGYDNIRRLLMLRGIYNKYQFEVLAADILTFSELNDFINLPVRTYSSGMQTRLIFSTITAETPEIMVMDEFFGAGDTQFQKKATERLNSNINQASILIFASHDMALLKRMCNRFFLLNHGNIKEVEI